MDQTTSRRAFLKQASALAGASLLSGLPSPSRASAGELAFMSAVELAGKVRAREVGAEELARYFIARIEKHDAALNAVVVRDFERALVAAKAADTRLARGDHLGPLHGVPMTIKESYDIGGLPTTWGVPAAAQNVPPADAAVVERLKDAGAVFLGKTNVPINLGDFQSYNDIYGTTNNPWDVSRTPGGSSGGSAAALAAGLTGLESGSDIGGSIRNPAHFCGVYGHKPTLGVVPMRGHQPPGVPVNPQHPDLAVVGPMARSADDLALALEIISGPNRLQAPGWRLELPAPRAQSLGAMRVAIWADDPTAPVDAEVVERLESIGAMLSGLGAKVSTSARPAFSSEDAFAVYSGILFGMTGGPESDLKFSEYLALSGRRGGMRVAWQQFFREWDVLLCPVTATPAFPQDQSDIEARTLKVNGEARPYFEQVFWAGLATLSYLPSTVFPSGLSKAGLPIGIQAMGAEYDDRTTIAFAQLMARELGGFQAPRGYA